MLACYHGHVEMAEGTIRSAGAVRGLLRVNVNPTFARLVLAPRIGLFLKKYTELLST
jgi:DNA-binding transcriptional LysR family regulator